MSYEQGVYQKQASGGVLKNFAKFTGKHLRRATLLKKRPWNRCFPVNFAKFLRTPFFIEHLWWLLLAAQVFSAP